MKKAYLTPQTVLIKIQSKAIMVTSLLGSVNGSAGITKGGVDDTEDGMEGCARDDSFWGSAMWE